MIHLPAKPYIIESYRHNSEKQPARNHPSRKKKKKKVFTKIQNLQTTYTNTYFPFQQQATKKGKRASRKVSRDIQGSEPLSVNFRFDSIHQFNPPVRSTESVLSYSYSIWPMKRMPVSKEKYSLSKIKKYNTI